MREMVRAACFEWVSVSIVGMLPLIAHAVLHFFATPTRDWDDNWSADVLFIGISNSGLSIVTTFSRMRRTLFKELASSGRYVVLMGLTVTIMFIATALYGVAVSGLGTSLTIWGAVTVSLWSMLCSLFFELALAD
jgi:hypothetical protein